MRPHPDEERLNDWADGSLAPTARAAVDEHLETCADCRRLAHGVRELLGALHALPREIAPPTDFRAGIGAAIDQSARPEGGRTLRPVRRQMAAAALVLIVLSSGAIAWFLRNGARTETLRHTDAAADEVLAAEWKYQEATAELEALLEDVRDILAPETVRVFEQSLAVLDRALDETRIALRADPANVVLGEIIMASYEQKLELLRRATELAET